LASQLEAQKTCLLTGLKYQNELSELVVASTSIKAPIAALLNYPEHSIEFCEGYTGYNQYLSNTIP